MRDMGTTGGGDGSGGGGGCDCTSWAIASQKTDQSSSEATGMSDKCVNPQNLVATRCNVVGRGALAVLVVVVMVHVVCS